MAHTTDASTVAHYRMNAATGSSHATALDSGPNARHLTVAGSQWIVGGYQQKKARYFDGTSDYCALADASALYTTFLNTDITVACWVYIDPAESGGVVALLGVSGLWDGSDTEPNNQIFEWFITTSNGMQGTFWEFGAGTNSGVNQASGATISKGVWTHVAVSVAHSGGNRTIKFYKNGVLTYTGAPTTQPTGGATATQLRIGDRSNLTGDMHGVLQSFLVHNGVASDATIAAWAAGHRHEVDGNTIALWQLDEEPDLLDLSDNNIHLKKTSGSMELAASPDVGTGTMLYFAAARFEAPLFSSIPLRLFGEMTVEAYVKSIGAVNFPVCGCSGTGELLAGNYAFAVEWSSTYALRMYHENGAGVNQDVLSTPVTLPKTRKHVAWRRRLNAGLLYLDSFVDGVLLGTNLIGDGSAPTGSTSSSFGIPDGPGAGASTITGFLGDVRISGVARTDAEILANALDLGGTAAATYHQRVYDSTAGWVYYDGELDSTPLAGDTEPNHTNNLVAGTHEVLGES